MNERPVLETLTVVCPRCGGQGGEPETNIDPSAYPGAWHPCYCCGQEGLLSFPQSIEPEAPEGYPRLWSDETRYLMAMAASPADYEQPIYGFAS